MKGPDFEALVARVAAAASRLGLPEPGGEGEEVVAEDVAVEDVAVWGKGRDRCV